MSFKFLNTKRKGKKKKKKGKRVDGRRYKEEHSKKQESVFLVVENGIVCFLLVKLRLLHSSSLYFLLFIISFLTIRNG